MAISATLVAQAHNHLRYLLVVDRDGGASVTITTTGAASPDLLTDSVSGPIRQCAQAFTKGIGILPAGALTQAQSRAIWIDDNSDTVLGNAKPSRCMARLTTRTGLDTVDEWRVDANVDGGGHPTVIVSAPEAGAIESSAYLDIMTLGPIGR